MVRVKTKMCLHTINMCSETSLIIKLQEAMRAYRRKSGKKMTYKLLEKRTGIPKERLASIGGRPGHNASLSDLGKICVSLNVGPGDLLEVGTLTKPSEDAPTNGRRRRKKVTARKKRIPKGRGTRKKGNTGKNPKRTR